MSKINCIEYDNGITAIDTDYIRPLLDACHLIVRDGRAALVDTGTAPGTPLVLEALRERNIAPELVDYVMVTHVHLDHAGGAGTLMAALPDARMVIHPRGSRHMIDPEKLIASTRGVYGDETFNRLYGTILPVAAERVIEVADGDSLKLGSSEFRFLHTPGHALHHYCIHDVDASAVFTGDTFGISYREFDTAKGAFIFPTTTPTQFDPAALHDSVNRIVGLNTRAAYLTHFGEVTGLPELALQLHQRIDEYVRIAEEHRHTGDSRLERIAEDLWHYLRNQVRLHGCELSDQIVEEILRTDAKLNAQGLDVWLDRIA